MGTCGSRSNDDLAAELIELQKKALLRDYPDPKDTLRDAHPKTVGLLRGEFEVRKDLPENLRVGVFAEEKVYPCWIRFSNAHPKPQSDLLVDKRGCAIKLLKENSETELGQDFVLMNTTVMPLGTPQLFRDVIYFAQFSFFLLCVKLFFKCQLSKFLHFLRFRTTTEAMLSESFHSTTPYAFGQREPVKYALLPIDHKGPAPVPERGFNYLTDEMQKYLESNDATFDFCVQFRTNPRKMPLDDASVEWSQALSPFEKVATLRIPAQQFTGNDRYEMAERLAFDLGRTLDEHKPLGSLNYVRHKVYEGKFEQFSVQRPLISQRTDLECSSCRVSSRKSRAIGLIIWQVQSASYVQRLLNLQYH